MCQASYYCVKVGLTCSACEQALYKKKEKRKKKSDNNLIFKLLLSCTKALFFQCRFH